jgi:hypothetical protein
MQDRPAPGTVEPTGLNRVWSDRRLRRRLIAQPKQALCEIGIVVPDGIEVKTVASKGSPVDPGEATLLQFVLTRGSVLSYFFLPSPRSVSAQQAAYGFIAGKSLDDPVFERYLREDAAAAIRKVCAALPGAAAAAASDRGGERR